MAVAHLVSFRPRAAMSRIRCAAQAKDRLQKHEQRIAEAEAEKEQAGRC